MGRTRSAWLVVLFALLTDPGRPGENLVAGTAVVPFVLWAWRPAAMPALPLVLLRRRQTPVGLVPDRFHRRSVVAPGRRGGVDECPPSRAAESSRRARRQRDRRCGAGR